VRRRSLRGGLDKAHSGTARSVRRVDLPAKQLAGWSVRYQRGREIVSRYFADRVFGGPDEAYAAAERFASEHAPDDGELLALLRRFSARKNSRSGIPGVTNLLGSPPKRNHSGWRTGTMQAGARCSRSSRFRFTARRWRESLRLRRATGQRRRTGSAWPNCSGAIGRSGRIGTRQQRLRPDQFTTEGKRGQW
jgi:hypothetical protein